MTQMSSKMQQTLDASQKQRKRRQMIGYIILGILVVVLAYTAWWVIQGGSERRFRGIEKFRGQAGVPAPVMAGRTAAGGVWLA